MSKAIKQERARIRDRIAMAYVNGHISHEQAEQALSALARHWHAADAQRQERAG